MADKERHVLRLNVDEESLTIDDKRGLMVKLLDELDDNGLSFNNNGELIATKGEKGDPGVSGVENLPGNAIGEPSMRTTDVIHVIRMNTTVSRRQQYKFPDEHDGVFVSSVDDNGNIVQGCLAHYIINGG